jgi:hypothetical protein
VEYGSLINRQANKKGAVLKERVDSSKNMLNGQKRENGKKLAEITPPVFAYYVQCTPNPTPYSLFSNL